MSVSFVSLLLYLNVGTTSVKYECSGSRASVCSSDRCWGFDFYFRLLNPFTAKSDRDHRWNLSAVMAALHSFVHSHLWAAHVSSDVMNFKLTNIVKLRTLSKSVGFLVLFASDAYSVFLCVINLCQRPTPPQTVNSAGFSSRPRHHLSVVYWLLQQLISLPPLKRLTA